MKYAPFGLVAAVFAASPFLAAEAPAGKGPTGGPAALRIEVSPAIVEPGQAAEVRVVLEPAPGIKINKYPRIRLAIPAAPGVVAEAEGSVGADAPPPPDRLETNYFQSIDPLRLTVRVDPGAGAGTHEIPGKLSYFYCVASSGYCAPARVDVKIPITIR
jgi:hypothetical protein